MVLFGLAWFSSKSSTRRSPGENWAALRKNLAWADGSAAVAKWYAPHRRPACFDASRRAEYVGSLNPVPWVALWIMPCTPPALAWAKSTFALLWERSIITLQAAMDTPCPSPASGDYQRKRREIGPGHTCGTCL